MDSPATLVPAKHVDIPKWLKTAQGIRQGGFFTVFSCLGNSLTVIVSCAFFAFGTFVLRHDGVPIVDVPHLGLLKDAARYGPTVFPIFLEAIVGKAVHALALYSTALLSRLEVKMSPMDTWGNVKIPMLERLTNLTKDGDGWKQVGNDNTTIYSSLIGVPLTALPTNGKTSFNIETWYWTLQCPILSVNGTDLPGTDINDSEWWGGDNTVCWGLSSPLNQFNTTLDQPYRIENTTGIPLRRIYYTSMEESDDIRHPAQGGTSDAICTMSTSYVEARNTCNQRNCSVTHMRPSRREHPDPALSLAFLMNGTQYWWSDYGFLAAFVTAIEGNSYKPTAIQRYFTNPAAPFDTTPLTSLIYKLDKTEFAIGLAQLLNTFWIAGTGLSQVASRMPASHTSLHNGTNTLSTVATISESTPVLLCNRAWLAALFVATSIMCLTGDLGLVLAFIRKTPDLAVNISSLTRDNPYIHLPPGGSALDSATRGRLLQNVRVRFGDVRAGEQVGYIAIGSCEAGDEGVIRNGTPRDVMVERMKGEKERVYV